MIDTHQNTPVRVEGSNPSLSATSEIRPGADTVAKSVANLLPERFSFFVPGVPGTAGSKKFVGHAKSTGRAILIDSSGTKGKNWRISVRWSCREAMAGLDFQPFQRGIPLLLEIDFQIPRIKGHFTSKGALRPSAPFWHVVKPDATKMLRAAEDALKDILWHDDGQIASQRITKTYSDQPGAKITVSALVTPAI